MDRMTNLEQLQNFLNVYEKEDEREFPSLDFLKQYAQNIFDIVFSTHMKNNSNHLLISLKHDVDIFKADLTELKDDFNKKNKRYKSKWLERKSRIDYYKLQLIKILSNNEI